MKIFVDAMGGDRAPDAVLKGTLLAVREVKAELVLLGDEVLIAASHAKKLQALRAAGVEFIHCPETIAMDESPVQAVRTKKESSIVKGLKLAAETPDSAFFSAGHSGAVFAAALLVMGRIEGVERPAIAAVLPSLAGKAILVDAGANVECRPQHLADFARMGATYAEVYLKQANPKIAVLSNGEEESKGTELTRAAHELLKTDPSLKLNYIGYLEGKEIIAGRASVIVTDGFTGNIVLKSLEGLGSTILSLFKREFQRNVFRKMGTLFLLPALRDIKKRFDYAETGSAPLLGVDGNCFIGHGRSNPKAIKNGILRAAEAVELQLHQKLREQFVSREK